MMCKGTVKIGDFGFAKKNVSNRMKIVTSVGTPLYMSPQVLRSEPYTSKCDVWATGFIFYEMLHGRTPWTAHSEFELVKNIETKPLIINPAISEHATDFLQRTLALSEK
jgi:serine/threonine protein kinase